MPPKKFTTANGYMTLKITLPPTEIARTIVVPECMTMTDLNDAIQRVMGWEHDHLWAFRDGRDGPTYEIPHEDDFASFYKRLTFDADETTIGKAFPKRGAKLTYEYDFGDGWEHVVTRMADPKTAEIACVKSEGPDGIEDFGGQYRLADFIEAMRKDPKDEEWVEAMEWAGFDDQECLKEYLAGESAEEKTAKLRQELAHVKVVVPTAGEQPKKMSDEEQARTLGLMFATTISLRVWEVLEDALCHDGKCEFVDHDQTISAYLMTMFDGLKIKDGVQTPFCTNPSKLTVHKKWVEWYKTYAKEWEEMRGPFDILEKYAASATRLYGALKLVDLYEIMLRYDPGLKLTMDEVVRYLKARALWSGISYRIDGDTIIDNIAFSDEHENSDSDVRELLKMQKDYPRWYPEGRDALFKWSDSFDFDHTPEVDQLELVLRSLRKFSEDEMSQVLDAIYGLISNGVPPDGIYKSMVLAGFIEKMTTNRRQVLLTALDKWAETVRIQCFNGNTVREIREIEAAKAREPKISRNAPCPCGSGKKYKMCCGKGA